ncbi:hypothetical protein WA588_002349 [Blastocystis sp. NMH]
MGSAGSKIQQKGIQTLKNVKTKVDRLPTDGITPEMLDAVLERGNFRPKTDALLKDAKERQEKMKADPSYQYVEQKDDSFVSSLESTMSGLASDHIDKKDLPFHSKGALPESRDSTPFVPHHISGKLTSDEMRDLLGSSSMFSSASGRKILAQQYELSSDTLDSLLRYVAVPQLEKRRENTKELDAVWPSWKMDQVT